MTRAKRKEVEHRIRMRKIQEKGMLQLMKEEEKAEREKYWPKKKINTSKAALWYMMIMCTIIQVFSLIAMWHFADLSPLTTLIGATVGEVFAYWAYTFKAAKENCQGGITYDMAFSEPEEQKEIKIGFVSDVEG
mgnify:FL=1